ncbi:MAG: hypothetical protein ACE15B_04250 [Bryobacteraceae bacterium]
MRLCICFLLSGAAFAQRYLPPPEVAPPRLAASHPRLSFRPAGERTLESVRALYRTDAAFRSIFDAALARATQTRDPAEAAAAWAVTADERFARRAAQLLTEEPISRTGSGRYSHVWAFALAWDWLHGHPALAESREQAAARITERLDTELDWLDDRGMALWHGRNQAANGAIVAALALGDRPGHERRLARATAHYVQALRALRFSEGWPEGPSYWIYNRAAPYALAADCFLTATGSDSIAGIPIRELMRTIGLWSLYQFGPNRVFEPYGDSSGSLRLGETGWWEVTADYFARLSRDPNLAAGADWFRKLSPTPYGKGPLRWWAALAYAPQRNPAAPERRLRDHLPQARLFGRASLGVAFFRGEWGDADELFASFKAGDLLAHHDHYDAGHFSIQYGGLLAPLTGIYGDPGGYYGAYRLGYAVQTVAANSLLILAPGETSGGLRAVKGAPWTALSGGQRVIRPTGFDCVSLEHFEAQRDAGPHLRRARITAFDGAPGRFDYVSADITPAYNSTHWAEPGAEAKVSLVTRQFLYLRPERAFVIYDRVQTTRPSYVPKFLLHALSKPLTGREKLLVGASADNGILESFDRRFTVAHQRGVLTAVSLLPERTRTLKIGGRNYYAYVEKDGDQSDGFDGVNLEGGDPALPRETKQLGLWRAEIEPAEPGVSHRFLTVLFPRLARESAPLPETELVKAGDAAHAVRIGNTVAVFARTPGPLGEVTLSGAAPIRAIVLDARPGRVYDAGRRTAAASTEGVLEIEVEGRSRTIRLRR